MKVTDPAAGWTRRSRHELSVSGRAGYWLTGTYLSCELKEK
jgi:hypothetical protein